MSNKDDFTIKYDLRQIKLLKIFLVVGIVLLIIFFSASGIGSEMPTAIYIVLTIVLYIGIGLTAFCSLTLVDGIFYIKRLKKHGYMIPDDKKIYEGSLEKLPTTGNMIDPGVKNRESLILAFISFAVFMFGLGYNIWLYNRWLCIKDNAVAICVMLTILDMYWLITGLVYIKQSNQEKYKDDVELVKDKKTRTSLGKGIVILVIMLAITFAAKTTGNNMLNYIYRSVENSVED